MNRTQVAPIRFGPRRETRAALEAPQVMKLEAEPIAGFIATHAPMGTRDACLASVERDLADIGYPAVYREGVGAIYTRDFIAELPTFQTPAWQTALRYANCWLFVFGVDGLGV